jgi:dolichyl-phosphate-mannose-protein mannosyltransferase
MTREPSLKIRENPGPVLAHPGVVFALIFVAIFLLHAPLLSLPYFWDEAGYYIPAARDLLLTGSLIPHSTVSNAHPPLVMAWVALWWKVFGYAVPVARSAMLVLAAFSLTGLFRLAERAASREVAIAATAVTAVYPVFFAQSSLGQVDLAAAGLTFWGLSAYLEERPAAVAIWFSLAALAKETAILAPLALVAWEPVERFWKRAFGWRSASSAALTSPAESAASAAEVRPSGWVHRLLPLLVPLLPLLLWYSYHYLKTGYVFGNPEFFRYNVAATLNPLRFLIALALRLWQAFGYMHLWVLTVATLIAMLLPPINNDAETAIEPCRDSRPRLSSRAQLGGRREAIAFPIQMVFYVVIAAYVVTMAAIGGAVLARYMLPAVPLGIIVAVSTLRRRLRYWRAAIALVGAAFIVAWFWNPPYGFSPEDNLAYRDYVTLHEDAESFLEARYPMAQVLTAWPASDELARPWLGYVTRPVQVVRIEDFSLEQVLSAAEFRASGAGNFDLALVFSTKYDPPPTLLERWTIGRGTWWEDLKRRFFGFHRDVPPAAAAQMLGGRIVFAEERKGQWVAVIEMEKSEVVNARVLPENRAAY